MAPLDLACPWSQRNWIEILATPRWPFWDSVSPFLTWSENQITKGLILHTVSYVLWLTSQVGVFSSVILLLGIAWCRKRAQCWIVGKKKLEDAGSPLPPLLPLTNNKAQTSEETNLKMVNARLRDPSWRGTLWSDIGQGNPWTTWLPSKPVFSGE